MPRRPKIAVAIASVTLSVVAVARAQIDNLATLVPTELASGSDVLLAGSYDPVTDTAYTTASILSGAGDGPMLRRITGVSTGSPVSTTVLTRDQFSYFMRDGDLTRTLRSAAISGVVFNPAPVGSIGKAGSLWFTDLGVTRLPNGSTTTDPAATKRVYRYNLGNVPAPGDNYAQVATVLTPMVSLANIQAAAGQPASTTEAGLGRQLTFSPSGQFLYGVDSSASFGGIYRIQPISGAIARIASIPTAPACEPAVTQVGGVDRIYFRSPSNLGGVSYVDHNPTTNTTSAETVLFTAAQLKDFMQTTVDPVISNLASDAAGNLYFSDGFGQAGNYRLLKLDTLGRLSKVTTRTERDLYFTGDANDGTIPSVNQFKFQPYAATHPTAGAVTRLSYVEGSPLVQLAAVTVFKTGDFNRDGLENAADLSLFKAKITSRNVTSDLADGRFDLNGNRVIDYRDVKILQSFTPFFDGDANLDRTVNFDDLLLLAANYNSPAGTKWTTGDFNGDDAVNFDDLLLLAANYNQTASGSSGGAWALAELATVPEPSAVVVGLVAGAAALRRARRTA